MKMKSMKFFSKLFKKKCLCSLVLVVALNAQVHAMDGERLNRIIKICLSVESESIQLNMLKGVLDGLNGVKRIDKPDSWSKLEQKLKKSTNPKLTSSLMMLKQKFGDAEAIGAAIATLKDDSQSLERRRLLLNSLLVHQTDELLGLLKELIESPLKKEVIRAMGHYDSVSVPRFLLKRYPQADSEIKQVIIETLSTRRSFVKSLLASMKEGVIKKNEIPAYVARNISSMSSLGERFDAIYGDPKGVSQNKAKLISDYKQKLNNHEFVKADPKKGYFVFKKTCAACHKMYGEGGDIGPDLTGSNRADQDYILLNIIDPSFDMPQAYRMVTIHKKDGQMLTGNIIDENQQKLTMNMVGTKITMMKSDIKSRFTSPVSMMPEGLLDTLSDKEFLNLIKYLQSEKQVEVNI